MTTRTAHCPHCATPTRLLARKPRKAPGLITVMCGGQGCGHATVYVRTKREPFRQARLRRKDEP